MKKLLSAILSAVLFFSLAGCTPHLDRSAEWGYFHFPSTDWGMTEEEFFSALGKKKEDFTVDKLQKNTLSYVTECTIFDEKMKTQFDFTTTLVSGTPRLSSVRWLYDTGVTKDKITLIMENLNKLFEEQGIAVEGDWKVTEPEAASESETTSYRIESKAKMTDLPQEVCDEYNKQIRALYKSGKYDLPALKDAENQDFVKIHNDNMSSASILEFNDSCFVSLNGNIVVQAAEYSKK